MLPFEEQAEDCRRQALSYVGHPEASLLIRIAREFDRLAAESRYCAASGYQVPGLVEGVPELHSD